MSGYVPLWCKSNYSFLEGASRPEELVERAWRLGLPAIALTDRDGVYGIVRAHLEARKRGLKLLIGSQLTVQPEGRSAPGGLGIVLLAQNREGYANLCGLISTGRLRSPKGSSRVNWEEICAGAAGLIALLDAGALQDREAEPIVSTAAALKKAFADRLYLLVSRHRSAAEKSHEPGLLDFASRLQLPLLAATEVLYHDLSRRRLQDVLTCIRHNCSLDEAGTRLRANAEHALRSAQELQELYRDLMADVPGIVTGTLEVADRCRFSLDEIQYRYPSEDLPDGQSSAQWLRRLTFQGARRRYASCVLPAAACEPEEVTPADNPAADSAAVPDPSAVPAADSAAVPDPAGRRRGSGIPDKVRRQLDRELDLIEELDYCGYFLTMWEIVEFCRRRGILCQGRGSAANSAVCYCLGITAVDPVRLELLFERFISRERNEPPDIDLDIEHGRREEVIQHVYEKYGRGRAAMVANFIRYRLRSAVRDVGKALGLPATRLDRLARLLPPYGGELRSALRQAGLDLGNPVHLLLAELAEEILDFPRHLSIHPGGFLLGSEPVSRFVPVENATRPGRTVIQWDKRDVEDMHLFKVDLLGLGALTQLDYCFRLLKRHRGLELSMAAIPGDDAEVFDLIGRADTVGVFQIESRAQMAMLPRLKPRSYYDLVIEISIVRPGPIVGGMVHPFLRRRRGEEPVEYPHPCLVPVLKKTLGVPLFQEQVMRLAMVAADYSAGEADQLRRDMAAWRLHGRLERHRDRLISRMMAKGIAKEFAERVFQQILGFGEYGFPESHAASFALIAYCTAWMKCRFPAEFTCALLNAWPMGFYAPSTIVEDARRRGLEVRPVDALASDWECSLEPLQEAANLPRGPRGVAGRFPASRPAGSPGYAVRMGLRFVKGLGEEEWSRIRAVREAIRRAEQGGSPESKNRRASLREFVERVKIPEDALAALAESGALRCFGLRRREALWEITGAGHWQKGGRRAAGSEPRGDGRRGDGRRGDGRRGDGQRGDGQRGDGQPQPGQPQLSLEEREPLPAFGVLSRGEAIGWDYLASAHSVQGHPLEPFREELDRQGLPDARELAERKDGSRVCYAGLVICRQRPLTAGGVVFMTLEDESGFVNLVVWSSIFEKQRRLILSSSLLGVTGTLQSKDGVVHLIVDSCWKPALSGLPADTGSRDFH